MNNRIGPHPTSWGTCNGLAFCEECRQELRSDPTHVHRWSGWYWVSCKATGSLGQLAIEVLKTPSIERHCEECLQEEIQKS